MRKSKQMVPYVLINTVAFYLLPYFIQNTGSGMLILLIAIPLICLITSITYGAKHAFNLFYGIVNILIFIPTIFIFYNESAAIYVPIYGVILFVGNLLGRLLSA